MATEKFSRGEAIRFGWETVKSNIGFFIVLFLLAFVIIIIPEIIGGMIKERLPIISFIFGIASWILQLIIGMGLTRITINFSDGKRGDFGDLFSCFHLLPRYLLGSILYGLIVMAGMILLIIPGIIWAIKFQFFSYLIVDKGMRPIESLKRSSDITVGVKWDLLLFGSLLLGLNFLGFLALLVGLLVTIPTSMVALAYVYRKLQSEDVDADNTNFLLN